MKTISMWKNVGRFTPREIAREDLPLKLSVRFTPPPKLPGAMEDLPLKSPLAT